MAFAAFESLVQEIKDMFGDESVEHFLYRHRPPAVAPRQVAWVPAKFKCAQPTRINSGSDQDTLFTELLQVEVHHHGVDMADACDIRIRVANAIRRVMRADSEPYEGYYLNADPDDEAADPFNWTSASVLVQRYLWKLNIPRIDDVYPAVVRTIAIVDSTQITTVVDGVLTPDEQLDIE